MYVSCSYSVTVSNLNYLIQIYTKFCYNSVKAAASHLTKLLSTEILLKDIPVRVNAIAPGAYESEMTLTQITPENVDEVGQSIWPLSARRAGT